VFLVLSVFAAVSCFSAWIMSRGFQKMAAQTAAKA